MIILCKECNRVVYMGKTFCGSALDRVNSGKSKFKREKKLYFKKVMNGESSMLWIPLKKFKSFIVYSLHTNCQGSHIITIWKLLFCSIKIIITHLGKPKNSSSIYTPSSEFVLHVGNFYFPNPKNKLLSILFVSYSCSQNEEYFSMQMQPGRKVNSDMWSVHPDG